MKCGVVYCVYNRDCVCLIKEIELNELGMCQECIIVSIPEQELNTLKEKQLEDILSRTV